MSATLPDRGHLLTEQRNPRTVRLDEASVEECVAILHDEDATVASAVRTASHSLCAFIRDAELGMRAGGRLIYIGAGTSGRLGVLDASECPPTFQTPPELVVGIIAGGDPALRKSSESKEDVPEGAWEELGALNLGATDTLLGIAAGGTTPYVLGAVEFAARAACVTGLLTCAPLRTESYARHEIVIETGPEAITGSTRMKAGTATKMALNTISTTLMVRLGKVHENLMVDLRATNAKLRDRAARIVGELTGISREEAFDLLDRAGGSVKTAAVMHIAGVDRVTAEQRLTDSGGVLRHALEQPSTTT